MKRFLLAAAVGLALLGAEEARAQFIVPGPYGSIGYHNPYGTYSFVYPGRLNPWANVPAYGTFRTTPFGSSWLGLDGRVHGNFVNPLTGNVHYRMTPHGSRHSGHRLRR
jgi:hypothetical protein